MKIALIHLSDIHLRTDRKNSVFKTDDAVSSIVSAVRSRLSEHEVEAIFLAVTGDIAYHGLAEEYKLAAGILGRIRDEIAQAMPGSPCHVVIVPGNHDCDFRTPYPELELRNRVLKTDGLENIDLFTARTICCVQQPYDNFAKGMTAGSDSRVVTETGPCVTTHDFQLSEGTARFYLLNTAWMSEQNEKQGRLVLPTAGLLEPPGVPSPAVAIVLQHHPKNWLRASNARDVTRRLEGLADLILTGHEHESDDSQVTRAGGAQVDYIEGHALQSDDLAGRPISAFKVIVADTASGNQITYDLRLNDRNLYILATDVPVVRPLSRNPKRLEQTFTWNERGNEIATDLGIPVTHERRDRVTLEELFVYPLVREIPLRKVASGRPGRISAEKLSWVGTSTLLVGGDLCGKTTLAKVFFATARQKRDLVPIYVRGIDIKRAAPKDCRFVVDSAYESCYATSLEKFRQLPRERKVIIIDDLHRSSQRGKAIDAVLRWCANEFGTIVALADNMLMLDDLVNVSYDPLLSTFSRYEILPFGHIKRDELVRRWSAVGESPENALEIRQRAARSMQRLDAIMGQRFVPHVPLFVIGILQQVELTEGPDNYTASQGAVFEALVTLKLQASFKAFRSTERPATDGQPGFRTQLAV